MIVAIAFYFGQTAGQPFVKAKGGDAMINTQVQENWFWAWVLTGYTTKISGDVVKLKNVQ
ncbi:hypothetical protein BK659_11695 [Pseudomonas brassicacearum]|uniref:Uncharacterized protein n=1 Tax=Pseudomonas brassicacearum TaxID=930166 RepID=A0A423H6V8_9PSED|nr:hypothetical protein [Pseudomonas brassicacearum]RON08907.1 hypothetical protein BK659_11695 [Pseudomonas brassicacearum]